MPGHLKIGIERGVDNKGGRQDLSVLTTWMARQSTLIHYFIRHSPEDLIKACVARALPHTGQVSRTSSFRDKWQNPSAALL